MLAHPSLKPKGLMFVPLVSMRILAIAWGPGIVPIPSAANPAAIRPSGVFPQPGVGGVPAAVMNGRTGLVVQPGDAAALANGILRLLRDPALSRKLGDAAFVEYERRYRPELTARKLEACFESLVKRQNWRRASEWKQLKDAPS